MYTKSNVINDNKTNFNKSQVKNECFHILDRLPKKPYCSNNLESGLKIRPLKTAIRYKYIQLNHLIVNYLVFDVDRPAAALSWEAANLPAPNLVVVNPENQHAHLIYSLRKGVHKFPDSSIKALQYLSAVEKAYTLKLAADYGYVGLIVKNPLCSYWTTWNIHNRQYELAELADYVDLKAGQQVENIITGVGRNVDIFENGRFWAYKAVREYRNKTYQDFLKAVFDHLNALNNLFRIPLPIGEVNSTAKSISKWTWQHDKEAYCRFISRQSRKGKLGGIASGISRLNNSKKEQAIKLKSEGYSITGIARELAISKRQVFYYFNEK